MCQTGETSQHEWLGACVFCLTDHSKRTKAITLMNGTSVCGQCAVEWRESGMATKPRPADLASR